MTSPIIKYEFEETQSPPATGEIDGNGNDYGYGYGYDYSDGNGDGAAYLYEPASTVAERVGNEVDDLVSQADQLEQRVKEVAKFYENKKQTSNNSKCKESSNVVKRQNEAGCSKRMQEVMRQVGTAIKQLWQHRYAWLFMEPVDVKGLKLHDYYEVIKKPMDFGTIKSRMNANFYKNAREMNADVRLIFSNAMTYNEKGTDAHEMAQILLGKFEEKWHQLLPKVIEAETRQKDEEAHALENMQIPQEATIAQIARDTEMELNQLDVRLDELKELLVRRCRKISTEEKRIMGAGLGSLPADDITKVMGIISEANPDFVATGTELDIDMDAQSEITLWRLKFFLKEALEVQAKNAASKADDISKRKQVIYDALAKTAKKR